MVHAEVGTQRLLHTRRVTRLDAVVALQRLRHFGCNEFGEKRIFIVKVLVKRACRQASRTCQRIDPAGRKPMLFGVSARLQQQMLPDFLFVILGISHVISL
jgi:hypothetical protein